MTKPSGSHAYQPEIQGLRTIAVLLVIFYHSGLPGLPGGYIGVDVFFVISGYLITSLILREMERTGALSLRNFYARRIRRLLPAAAVVLTATIIIAWFVYSPLNLKQFSSSAFATAVYLSNAWFAHLSTDYLAEDTGANPLLHTWSLGVEEQFYIVWPILLLMVFRWGARDSSHRRLWYVFIVTFAVSLSAAVALTQINQPWAFFSSPTRAWEFAVGAMVGLWSQGERARHPMTSVLMGLTGMLCIFAAAAIYTRQTPFPGYAALLPALGTAAVILSVQRGERHLVKAILSQPLMQRIGDMSYSLYLWHWPVFVYADYLFTERSLAGRFASIALVFLLSWLTLRLVENPIRFSRPLSGRATRSLALGMGLTFSVAGIAFGVRAIAADNLDAPEQKLFQAAKNDRPRIYSDNCHLDYPTTQPKLCSYGAETGAGTIVLFGDSHAAHWFPPLEAIASRNGWRLLSMTKSGCPSFDLEPYDSKLGRFYTECTEWRKNVIEHIARLRPSLIILSNSRGYFSDQSGQPQSLPRSLERTLKQLAPVSERIAVVYDTPWIERDAPDCLSHAAWLNRDPSVACRFSIPSQAEDPLHRSQDAVVAKFTNAFSVDMNNTICDRDECSVYENGITKFSDRHHLTKTYSLTLADDLEKKLRRFRD